MHDVSNEFRFPRPGSTGYRIALTDGPKAARYYGVNLSETDRHQLGIYPQHNWKVTAAKAAATRHAHARTATTERGRR